MQARASTGAAFHINKQQGIAGAGAFTAECYCTACIDVGLAFRLIARKNRLAVQRPGGFSQKRSRAYFVLVHFFTMLKFTVRHLLSGFAIDGHNLRGINGSFTYWKRWKKEDVFTDDLTGLIGRAGIL